MSGFFSSLGRTIDKNVKTAATDLDDMFAINGHMSGLFSSLKKELNSAATTIGKEVGYAAKKAEDTWDESTSLMAHQFRTGNVVQLISRSSGRSLQVVQSPTGQLVVDGCGPEGPQAFNANWTVHHVGGNRVRLQNNHNYLAVYNGMTCVVNYPPPAVPGPETEIHVIQIGKFVSLEILINKKFNNVGVMQSGQLKSAVATGRELDGQWGVRIIYAAPKPVPQQRAAPPTTVVVQQRATAPVAQQGTTTYINAGPGTTIITQQQQQQQQPPPYKH